MNTNIVSRSCTSPSIAGTELRLMAFALSACTSLGALFLVRPWAIEKGPAPLAEDGSAYAVSPMPVIVWHESADKSSVLAHMVSAAEAKRFVADAPACPVRGFVAVRIDAEIRIFAPSDLAREEHGLAAFCLPGKWQAFTADGRIRFRLAPDQIQGYVPPAASKLKKNRRLTMKIPVIVTSGLNGKSWVAMSDVALNPVNDESGLQIGDPENGYVYETADKDALTSAKKIVGNGAYLKGGLVGIVSSWIFSTRPGERDRAVVHVVPILRKGDLP